MYEECGAELGKFRVQGPEMRNLVLQIVLIDYNTFE